MTDDYFFKIVATIISGGVIWMATSVTNLGKQLSALTTEVASIKENLGSIGSSVKMQEEKISEIEKTCLKKHGGI